jgi:Xaa-Pro aminopeptidase
MRRERHERLVAQMDAFDVDVLIAALPSAVFYATGALSPAADAGRSAHRRAIAVVTRDGAPPALYTPYSDGVPEEYPKDHVHGGLDLEWSADADALVHRLPKGRLAIDDCTMPLRAALGSRELVDAGPAIATAKVVKTADELECIRRAQAINEAAIEDVQAIMKPGVTTTELSARLFQRLFELGVTSNTVDPIWQVMGREADDRPMSITGEIVFPMPARRRELVNGDLVWVDNGVSYRGYHSDYGNSWIVGRGPTAREREHYAVWRELLDRVLRELRSGVTSADLTRAAGEVFGRRPWLTHFYLAHGTGVDSAELPLVGTDLGDEYDANFVLASGMVLVFEPITWEEGVGGFRAEQIVCVTDDGFDVLSSVDSTAWT